MHYTSDIEHPLIINKVNNIDIDIYVKIHWKNIIIIFLSIGWWLSEDAGCSYGVDRWNKFIIAKWQFYNKTRLILILKDKRQNKKIDTK